jgi:DnaA N-terminal domain
MESRKEIETVFDVGKKPEALVEEPVCGINSRAPENTNSLELEHDQQARIPNGEPVEDWKIERLDGYFPPTQATSSMSSYKAQIDGLDSQRLWASVQSDLQERLSGPAFETWIRPAHFVGITDTAVTLAVKSDFNRVEVLKRYRATLSEAFSHRLGYAVKVSICVDPELDNLDAQPEANPPTSAPVRKSEYPLAQFQNPTHNPQVATLLEKYGDMRQVILHSPIFREPCAKVSEGGWGSDVAGLISLGKQYTLERLLWAVREAKNYRGTRSKGAYMSGILKKGLEGASCR